jgi:hypothetical protein
MEEIWKDIKGFEDSYQINNNGIIKSKISQKGEFLHPFTNKTGYMIANLWRVNEKRTPMLISRLVAIHFIPNPDNKPCVNHKDGNKQNNNANNLEWVTYHENTLHAHRILKIAQKRGHCSEERKMKIGLGNTKFNKEIRDSIISDYNNGVVMSLLKTKYNMSYSSVYRIIKLKPPKSLNYENIKI